MKYTLELESTIGAESPCAGKLIMDINKAIEEFKKSGGDISSLDIDISNNLSKKNNKDKFNLQNFTKGGR